MKEIREYRELREQLAFYAEDEYRDFIIKGIPSERPFLGVRVPLIRKVVDLVPRDLYEDFLRVQPVAFEEVMARGMLVCKLPYEEMLKWFDSQLRHIDDWCACDTFCLGVSRVIRGRKEEFLDGKIEGLLDGLRGRGDEFAVRAGLVILKCAYVEPEYLGLIFDRAERLKGREEYYIRMAIAWLIAECFVKFPEVTLGYLQVSQLPRWTFNKTISKICDSYRVDEDMKEVVRRMRK